ncbi:MAG TPA: gamma-glutamyltransferase [Candidatus Acidoferrum sp.]|nr:gamma-glutamyltransferase [Candidatus Acidoferrum sp.]
MNPLRIARFCLAFVVACTCSAETLIASSGIVTSRSAIASDVGKQILQQGGNAVDAAVATAFALAVAYPSAGNIGGGGFMVIALANGKVVTQDNREKAPSAASRDMFLDANGNVDRNRAVNSLQASGVPGTVAGLLDALEKYGTMKRAQVMAPAIKLAREGFILNDDIAGQFAENLQGFKQYPASLAKFTHDGEPYKAGERWIQKDLADVLEKISKQGRDGFYQGDVADKIVAEMQKQGGLISKADLENYRPVWREPIHGTYHGYDVWSMPPPSSGGVLLVQMLNMLEPYDLGKLGFGSSASVHLLIEAQRRAFADRAEYLGDPDFVKVPAAKMIDKNYAKQRFSDFDPQHASDSAKIGAGKWPEESPQTTHFSVVDSKGNAVSMTTTLNRSYGNRIVIPGTGILMNNEMDDFSSKPNTPNSYGLIGRDANEIQPGKRMLSSMTPTIVMKGGKVLLVTGSPGGSTIINTVLQVVVNVLDHHMNAEQAVTSGRIHHQWMPDNVRYENGAIKDDAALNELKAMGHKGLSGGSFGIGDANSVLVNGGKLEGVSDPRNVGGVAGF